MDALPHFFKPCREFLLASVLAIFTSLNIFGETVIRSNDTNQSVILEDSNNYSWDKTLNDLTFWVSNPAKFKMEKYHFHDDFVLIKELDLRNGLYDHEEVNSSYSINADGVLIIGTGQDIVHHNVINIEKQSISTKTNALAQESKFVEIEEHEFPIVFSDGSLGQLTVNSGKENGELPDLFVFSDSTGGIISSSSEIEEAISYLDSLDDNFSYPFPKWIELKNQPALDALTNFRLINLPSHHFFFAENDMREFHESSAYSEYSDGPLTLKVPKTWKFQILDDYFRWGDTSYYSLNGPRTNEFISLTITYDSFHSDLDEWTQAQKSNYLEEFPSTFQNEDGNLSTTKQGLDGKAIIHGYSDGNEDSYNFSLGIDLGLNFSGSWMIAKFSGNAIGHNYTTAYETALFIAQSIELDSAWNSPKPIELNNSAEPYFAVIYPDSNAKVPDSRKTDQRWYLSDWFGYYFQTDSNGWIFHPEIGWIYAVPNHQDKELWFYGETLGWMWTNANIFPFLYSDVSSNWIFYMKSNSSSSNYGQYYDYQNLNWKQTNQLFDRSEVINRNLINYKNSVVRTLEDYLLKR